MSTELAQREHVVYHLFDHNGVLLYVGLTCELPKRLRAHAAPSGSPWWSDVDESRTTFTTYPSRAMAVAYEAVGIDQLQPLHNSKSWTGFVSEGRPRGTLTGDQRMRLADARDRAQAVQQDYRAEVVAVLTEGASFAEVSKATGLSTNTLQRWKREAGK